MAAPVLLTLSHGLLRPIFPSSRLLLSSAPLPSSWDCVRASEYGQTIEVPGDADAFPPPRLSIEERRRRRNCAIGCPGNPIAWLPIPATGGIPSPCSRPRPPPGCSGWCRCATPGCEESPCSPSAGRRPSWRRIWPTRCAPAQVQACGDMHANIGLHASAERNLVLAINDFDETQYIGPLGGSRGRRERLVAADFRGQRRPPAGGGPE